MASALTTSKLFSENKVQMFDHDPGATSAKYVTADGGTTIQVADMRDYEYFAALVKPTIVGGNGITLARIMASASSDMSSAVEVKTSGAVQADALADYIALECTVEELAALGTSLRYLALEITHATATDESAAVYIQSGAKRATNGLTATTIA